MPLQIMEPVDHKNGPIRWSEELFGVPAISSNGTIYVIGASKLYALTSTGSLLWTYDKDDAEDTGSTSAVISSDGTIYFGCSTGLYAINPDGKLKWSYSTSGGISGSPAISKDGTLYIGTVTGVLYAFNDNCNRLQCSAC